MKKLEKNEMIILKGGQVPPGGSWQLTGWNLENGNCYCDYHTELPNGGSVNYCHVPCPASNCAVK